ncbi:hypothetical protein LSH36_226g02003 [Paralvinella palmiformis]|uniref:Thiopurine S-methyltransferase n=1 Tax=Paralvinella palmiformis TaxID=53620 RepID=A0AAD9JMP9_9ANNE|nr:hypothetical protein LSH36_226g02003 [Paralvinella palmiformis]
MAHQDFRNIRVLHDSVMYAVIAYAPFVKRLWEKLRDTGKEIFNISHKMTYKQDEPQYWLDKWQRGNTDWHLRDVNPWLYSNIHLLTGGREHIKVFIPLCGKSVEIKWLADMGHTVVGVDVSSIGMQEFFSDMALTYTVNPVPELLLFCSTLEGLFDAVWDRAAMVALSPELMEKYHITVESLMAPSCQYIVELFDYAHPGKPSSSYNVDVLERFTSQYFKEKFDASYLYIEMVRIAKI